MDSLYVSLVGFVTVIVSAATYMIKRWISRIDKEVNHKHLHGRTETLYELAHRTDRFAEQTFELTKNINQDVIENKKKLDGVCASHRKSKQAVDELRKDFDSHVSEMNQRLDRLEGK